MVQIVVEALAQHKERLGVGNVVGQAREQSADLSVVSGLHGFHDLLDQRAEVVRDRWRR
ncbi:hypothetical protein [Streptomyces sp. NBC_01637]|uniref:hypothetical protein n=1 Tax=unclassified Streptomyces TaxID=2593676 RepID=UPI00386C8ABE|nr:hypothetical protein OH719_23285 [Streptomyces sp. NBC_01653]WTD34930.1 hypothetical protein OHB03_23405 [Streptomyces sp. NBC_01643]WTD90336.1 hypothetical protein OG891_23590 [Streptomyces sp. NBC_01637]